MTHPATAALPAGARRGLRRRDVGDRLGLAAARHADRPRGARRGDAVDGGHRRHAERPRQRPRRLRLLRSPTAPSPSPATATTSAPSPTRSSITYMAPGRLGRPADRRGARGLSRRAERHLRRARDERPGRAGGGVPRPLAHRQGNPPAGVTGASNELGGRRMTTVLTRPEGLDRIENASRDEIAALQLERMKWSVRHAYENSPLLPQAVRRPRRASGRPEDAGRPREVPVHREAGPARHLSVRHVRRAARAAQPHPRLVGDDRQADGGRLHQEGHRHLGGPDRPLDLRLGRPAGGHRAHRLRLRPLHRRPRARTTAPSGWAAPWCRSRAG